MKPRRMIAACVLAICATAWPLPVSYADDSIVLVSDDARIQTTHSDGSSTAGSLTISNNTDAAVELEFDVGGSAPENCDISADPAEVEALRQQTVNLTFTDCGDDVFSFTPSADGTPLTELTAEPPTTPDPNWWFLLAFPLAALAGAITLFITFLVWEHREPTNRAWRKGLPGLAASWSFKESWASNATVLGAGLTGVVGATDIAKSIFGPDADDVTAMVGVASAIALGLAGGAPMLLQAFRTRQRDAVTGFGIFAAGSVTLAAAAGELSVGTLATIDSGLADSWVDVLLGLILGLALVLLGFYAVRATLQNLRAGENEPVDSKTPTIVKRKRTGLPTARQAVVDEVDVLFDGELEHDDIFQIEYAPAASGSTAPAALL